MRERSRLVFKAAALRANFTKNTKPGWYWGSYTHTRWVGMTWVYSLHIMQPEIHSKTSACTYAGVQLPTWRHLHDINLSKIQPCLNRMYLQVIYNTCDGLFSDRVDLFFFDRGSEEAASPAILLPTSMGSAKLEEACFPEAFL